MSTLYLVLTWAVLGLLSAALVHAALRSDRLGWPARLIFGLLAALLGGLLGFWLLGRLFSAVTALWVAILLNCVPDLFNSLRDRFARHR